MKKKYLLIIFLALTYSSYAQDGKVGIKTEDPQATLDVNGNVRIQTVPNDDSSTKMLVLGTNNVISQGNIPRFLNMGSVPIPICNNVSVNSTGSFTITPSNGTTYTITWTVLNKQTGTQTKNTYPAYAQRLQIKYNFSPSLPYIPDGFSLTVKNTTGSTSTFSINYAQISQSSITINVTRTDQTTGDGTNGCWSGQFYFDMMMFKYQS
ncbi:hypothetical protein ACG2LH_13305 [Zhouia sp. PK063]|uniref:hypothetical protein n=1 Tax=Zhouia sp. PK063 TaxID=3373602 RepID=UPI0037BE1036